MLLKSPNRRKSEVATGGGLDSGTGAAAFNGSYVGTVESGAIGQQQKGREGNSGRSAYGTP
jgi:hypothetical protein